MKQYQSHKIVEAAKIIGIEETCLHLDDGSSVDKVPDWILRHSPEIGGYYVTYDFKTEGAYSSYSPAGVFEKGYAPVEQPNVASTVETCGPDPSWQRQRALELALEIVKTQGRVDAASVIACADQLLGFIEHGLPDFD